MKNLNFNKLAKNVHSFVIKHSPEFLTGIGITGMVTTTILAVKSTPKALTLMEERKKELCVDKLKATDKIKTVWKCYIPSVFVGSASIVCLVHANSVSVKRNAALLMAYTLSESTLKEYREKVVETIGEKKEQGIRHEIAKDKLNKDPVSNHEVFVTKKGNTLCYDVLSGRYFKADIESIRQAVNALNRRLLDEMYISLNDFYFEIGLQPIKLGEELGWDIERGYIDLNFGSALAEGEIPCLVLDYLIAPQYSSY